ncbi:MAG TPA: hypothetical protein VEI97_05030, partial [bacterium]|nr:hypothetical protein [bacterium]
AVDVIDDDSALGGDTTIDSGRPGDELFYEKTVLKAITSGQTSGTYTGLARATDPEVNQTDPLFVIELDGSLSPLSSNIPVPEAYQAFTVAMLAPNSPPSVTVSGPGTNVPSGNGILNLTVNAYGDVDGDPIAIAFDWNNDGDYDDTGEGFNTLDGTPPDVFASPLFYNNTTLSPVVRTVPYKYTDNVFAAPLTSTVGFNLGPNQAPSVGSATIALAGSALTTPATFSVIASGMSGVSDPEGDPITYTVVGTPAPSGSPVTTSGVTGFPLNGAAAGPWSAPVQTVTFTAYANDPLHVATAGTQLAGTPVGTIDAGWAANFGGAGATATVTAVAVTPVGVRLAGILIGAADFDPGPTTLIRTSLSGSQDPFCVAMTPGGAVQWAVVWGSPANDQALAVQLDSAGNTWVAGTFQTTADFDPGGGTANSTSMGTLDAFAVKLSPSGAYVTHAAWGGATSDEARALVVDGNNSPRIGGFYTGTVDFDPGTGVATSISNGAGDSYGLFLDATGAYQTHLAWGGSALDEVRAIALDASGAPRFGGRFTGTADFNPGPGTSTLSATGITDCYVMAASALGAFQWVMSTPTTGGSSQVNSMVYTGTPTPRLAITGYFAGSTTFGSLGVRVASNTDPFLYTVNNGTGSAIAVSTWGSTDFDYGYGVVVDSAGNLRVTGQFSGTVDFNPGAGTVNRTAAAQIETYVLALDPSHTFQ